MFIGRKTLLIKKVRHGAKASGFNLANRQHCPLDLIAWLKLYPKLTLEKNEWDWYDSYEFI